MTTTTGRFTVPELIVAIAEQEAWVAQCGGDQAGYVARYGSKADAEYHGNGGEAIFAADYEHLEGLRERLAAARRRGSRAPVERTAARLVVEHARRHRQPRPPKAFADSLKGAALYVLEQWLFQQQLGVQPESDEYVRTGKMSALSGVLEQITGRLPSGRNSGEQWADIIDAMP